MRELRAAEVEAGCLIVGEFERAASFALQDTGGGPHYISIHVGCLSPSPQRPICLFREPQPF